MRASFLAIAAVVASCVVACGGGDEAEPLTLEQRLVRESEVPGSEPDPMEERIAAGNLSDFMASDTGAHVESSKLEEAGFVSAVQATRFYPEAPGDRAPEMRLTSACS